MRKIAVLNQKGGCGKTTVACNLATAGHLAGLRTLVLDLDEQGSAFEWYSVRPEGSPLDGLTVAKADKALTLPRFRELASGYELVICDGPPRLGKITQAAAVFADLVLVPLRPGPTDWWAVQETLDLLSNADDIRRELGLPESRHVFLVNGAQPRTKATQAMLDAIAQSGGQLAPVMLQNRVAYADSLAAGESVLTFGSPGPAASEIGKLWSALTLEVAA